jgi:hypothetical protein
VPSRFFGLLAFVLWVAPVNRVSAVTINYPPNAGPDEIQAGQELSRVWIEATGDAYPWTFNLQSSPIPGSSQPDAFRIIISQSTASDPGEIITLQGATPLATRLAVDWFLSQYLKVRWFIPGPLGEVIPHWGPGGEGALPIPEPVDKIVTPRFLSRELGGLGKNGAEWSVHNGLFGRWPHSHALVDVFPASEAAAHPDWFPMLEGKRYVPTAGSGYDWQPNLANPEVVAAAARYAIKRFRAYPHEEAVSLSENDSIRFDQSPATLAARGPLRWFRGKPDYSNLVFGFMNQVADAVAKDCPGKLLSAYAYNWCENTPNFPVRANIIPWLTADRTQWFDPAFAREDRALIRRWCHSGASVVGIYDYLYGAPYLVPRVPVHLIADSVRFAYGTGVRAYYAECHPHWGFDGPKLWMLAQLLWDPGKSPDGLLEEYYRTFYGESAEPMKLFYQICEQAWLRQPRPGRWIKYYEDGDQAMLFPPTVLARLAAALDTAKTKSRTKLTSDRIELVAADFAVTEAFCALMAEKKGESHVQSEFEIEKKFARAVGTAQSLSALAPLDTSVYTRMVAREASAKVGPIPVSLLKDPVWQTLSAPAPTSADIQFQWSPPASPWVARGAPGEHRKIQFSRFGPYVEYSGAIAERVGQWLLLPLANDQPTVRQYAAETEFSGKVTPGDESFLVVNFMDNLKRFVGEAAEARVPPGKYSKPIRLALRVTAPPGARFIGAGIYIFHQNPGDWARFSVPRLGLEAPVPVSSDHRPASAIKAHQVTRMAGH